MVVYTATGEGPISNRRSRGGEHRLCLKDYLVEYSEGYTSIPICFESPLFSFTSPP